MKVTPKYRDISVIVLSSLKTKKEIEEYRQMGIIDYLVKPASYDDYVKVAAKLKSRTEL